MAPDILDVDEVVKAWAKEFRLEKDEKKLVSDEILSSDINWSHFNIEHETPKYDDDRKTGTPHSHVLVTTVFANSTDKDQVYSFKTERKTKSTCMISITRSFRIESHLDVKLTPPNPIIQANAGFKGELSLNKVEGETFEEELTWSVDSQVTVSPNQKTTAELVIKEEEYSGHFTIKSRFEGKVHVTLRNKKDHSIVTTLTGDAEQIFTQDRGFLMDGRHGPYAITQGICKCKYGIEQQVKLSQTDCM